MPKSDKHKTCKLTGRAVAAAPGTILNVYGHQWTVQKDGVTALADIHVDFHKVEIASGRYILLEDDVTFFPPPPEQNLDEFSMDPSTFFGMDNLDEFKKKLMSLQLRNESLRRFAKTRLNVIFPETMTKAQMLTSIIELTSVQNSEQTA